MLKRYRWWLGYAAADLVAAGMGMGVPFFCIALGVPVGWLTTRRALASGLDVRSVLARTLAVAALSSGFTLVLMTALWAQMAQHLDEPTWITETSGIPQILYDPVPSLAAWLVLMIVISPILQLLITVFSGVVVLVRAGRPQP